jgi:hypothetical protein
MPSLVLAALTLAFAVLSIASGATSAQTLDPHVLYEERCASPAVMAGLSPSKSM